MQRPPSSSDQKSPPPPQAQGDGVALSKYCSAESRLCALKKNLDEVVCPLNQEAKECKAALRAFLEQSACTCFPVEVPVDPTDPKSELTQMYLRLQTSNNIKPISYELLEQCIEGMTVQDLNRALKVLQEKKPPSRRAEAGSAPTVTVVDVWVEALNQKIRDENTRHAVSVALTTTKERKKAVAGEAPPTLPDSVLQKVRRLHYLQAIIQEQKSKVKDIQDAQKRVIAENEQAVVQHLRESNPIAMEKRLTLKSKAASPNGTQRAVSRSAVVKCSQVQKKGEVRITHLLPQVRTTMIRVFQTSGLDCAITSTNVDASLSAQVKQSIKAQVMDVFNALSQSRTTVTSKLELKFD